MRSSIILGLFSIFTMTQFGFSPMSIGFKNPEIIKPLLDYRLPTWGYRAFSLNLNLSGNRNKSEYRTTLSSHNSSGLNLGLNPGLSFKN